jgi:hypothetical protein
MQEALGRLYDVVSVAAGQSINLRNAAGVTFICSAAAVSTSFTVNSQLTAGGSATALTAVTRVYTRTAHNGTVAWTDSGDITAESNVPCANGSEVAFYIDAADLPAAANYVEVVVTGTGTAIAVLSDLFSQQNPKYLPAPGL